MSRPSFGELGGQDPYEILELPWGASDDDVRAARKRLMRKYHPDLPSGDLRRTQLITAAADLLLDPLRRIGYYDLRDDGAGRSVFAAAGFTEQATGFTDQQRRATRPDHVDAAGTGPAQRIRPTFVTPPGSRGQDPPPVDADHGYGDHGYGDHGYGDHGYGDPADRPNADTRWNALAIASVVAILTWTPIPLVLGLLALRQIRRHGQRGRGLALAGVIVGAVFVLVYVYVLVLPHF